MSNVRALFCDNYLVERKTRGNAFSYKETNRIAVIREAGCIISLGTMATWRVT